MRDELTRLIQERTGLDEATARQATAAVIDFLKAKLPPQARPMLDLVFGGAAATGGATPNVDGATGMANPGGLLGELFGVQPPGQP